MFVGLLCCFLAAWMIVAALPALATIDRPVRHAVSGEILARVGGDDLWMLGSRFSLRMICRDQCDDLVFPAAGQVRVRLRDASKEHVLHGRATSWRRNGAEGLALAAGRGAGR
jgi:hypothetical protein